MGKLRKWVISAIVFILIGIILFLNISDILRRKSGGGICTFFDCRIYAAA